MITPSRICKQFLPIVKLANYLLNFDCREGAVIVADCISANMDDQFSVASLTNVDVGSYFYLILALEMNYDLSPRVVTFVSFFHKLESSLQCRLLLELKAQVPSHLKGIKSCQFMFDEMCKTLPDHNLRALNGDMVVDMLKCCVRLGNVGKLNRLTSNICLPLTSKSNLKNELLENVISSPVMLQLVLSSELGKTAVASLVNAQLELVKNQFSAPQEHQRQKPLLKSLSSCLLLAMMLEKESLVSLSTSLATKLSAPNLCHILQDVLKPDNHSLLRLPHTTSPHIRLPSPKSQDDMNEPISGVPDYLPNAVPSQQFIPRPTSSFQFSFRLEDHSAPVVPLPTSADQPRNMGPTRNTDFRKEAHKSPPTPSVSGPSPDEFVSPLDNLYISSGQTEVDQIPETETHGYQTDLETESSSLIESATGDEELAVDLPIPKKSRVEVEEIPPEEVSKVVDNPIKKKKGRDRGSLQREVAQPKGNFVDFLKGTGDLKSRRCRPKSAALVGKTEELESKTKGSADILVTPPVVHKVIDGLLGRQLYACGNMGCEETAKTVSVFKVHILHVIFDNSKI